MILELNEIELDEVSGGSKESYDAGKQIGVFIIDLLAIIF